MELRQIEYFCKACEYLKISAAARELFISEQALSRQIALFERECGFSLFTRSSKGLELTRSGRATYERALGLLDSLDSFRMFLHDIKEEQAKIAIHLGVYVGFLISSDGSLSVENLLSFSKKYGGCALFLHEESNEQICHRVSDGSLDMGVFVGETPPGCTGAVISKVSLCAVVSLENALSRKRMIDWVDLEGQKIIHICGKQSMRRDVEKICERHGAAPLDGGATVSAMSALQYVYANAGIVLLDRRYANVVDSGKARLVPLPEDAAFTHPDISVIWRQDFEYTLIHKKLVEFLKKMCD